MESPAKVVAGIFSLSAFAVAALTGLAVGNPASDVLGRALVCLVIAHLVGVLVGSAFESVLARSVAARHGVVDLSTPMVGGSGTSSGSSVDNSVDSSVNAG